MPSDIPKTRLETEGTTQHTSPLRATCHRVFSLNAGRKAGEQYHLFCTSKSDNSTCLDGPARVVLRDILDNLYNRISSMPRANEIKKGMV
ncbi:elongation factor P-like protein YeiP, partial [Salmonella enterica subsp. enterica serovar Typhimurium]